MLGNGDLDLPEGDGLVNEGLFGMAAESADVNPVLALGNGLPEDRHDRFDVEFVLAYKVMLVFSR